MSLSTRSRFYYGVEIDSTNNQVDFTEAGVPMVATLSIGAYSFTDLATEFSRALNAAGDYTYTVTANRSTRTFTVATTGLENFELLGTTGVTVGTSALPDLGFAADQTGTNTYTGTGVGTAYSPQFVLQSYVSSEDFRSAVDAVVNTSASGKVEIFSFGSEKFVEFNIRLATNVSQPTGHSIENSATGVEDLRLFMRHICNKFPVEFMADRDTPNTFETLILEKTPEDQKGVKYKLRELYDKNLPGYYETGVLTMRVIE
jgi:hypothetical protein